MALMKTDELEEYLDSLQRDTRYRVDAVLKEGSCETTQRVAFVGEDGSERGPYVRKYIKRDSGMGSAYARIREAQRNGCRFRFIPRIVDCYTTGEDDVVIMEYVQGETLRDAVARCGASMELAADVFPRLCDAASELHESLDAPIIHRDFKPSNIVISRDSLMVIDLGIARLYRDGAHDDTRHFGTRAYAPPEQFGFGQTTVRSDVYALGMLLYFCLTGCDPDPESREDGFRDSRIPEPVRAVLLKATEFDPSRRFADARALRAAFCRAAATCGFGGIVSASAGDADRTPSVRGRNPHAGRSVSLRDAVRSAAERIPVPLCVAWNVLVTIAAGMLFVGCVCAAFFPNQADASYPLWFRIVEYVLFAASNVALGAYVLFDKRRLYRAYPRLPRASLLRQTAFFAAYFFSSFVVVALVMAAVS